jgi:hypothetical protein
MKGAKDWKQIEKAKFVATNMESCFFESVDILNWIQSLFLQSTSKQITWLNCLILNLF